MWARIQIKHTSNASRRDPKLFPNLREKTNINRSCERQPRTPVNNGYNNQVIYHNKRQWTFASSNRSKSQNLNQENSKKQIFQCMWIRWAWEFPSDTKNKFTLVQTAIKREYCSISAQATGFRKTLKFNYLSQYTWIRTSVNNRWSKLALPLVNTPTWRWSL